MGGLFLGGEGRSGGEAALCFPPDARGESPLFGQGGVYGRCSARNPGGSRAERNAAKGKSKSRAQRAGEIMPGLTVRQARKTAGDAKRVRPGAERAGRKSRADGTRVCGAPVRKHMRGEALDRKLRKRAGGGDRSGRACRPRPRHSSPHPRSSPITSRKAPRKHFPQSVGRIAGVLHRFGTRLAGKPCLAEDSRALHAPVRSSRARCSSFFRRFGARRRSRSRSWQGKKNQL